MTSYLAIEPWGKIMLLRHSILLVLVFSLCRTLSAAPIEKISGLVFLDTNGNSRLDPDEKGLPGIPITDGVNFALTGEDGEYKMTIAADPVIPFKPAQVISIGWPSDTWPTSSWCRRVADIKAGKPVNFSLRKVEQKLPFKIVHGTDPHDNFGGGGRRLFRDDVKLMGKDAAFSIITGDLGYAGLDGAHAMFSSVQRFTQNFPIPMFHTIGNHDVVGIHSKWWNGQSEIHGNGAFTKYLGPIRWSFNYAGIHLVGLDWALVSKDGSIQLGIPRVAIDWLEKDLARLKPGTRIMVFIHSQYSPDKKFYQLVAKHKIELILAGHSHRNLDMSIPGTKILTTMNLRGPYRLVQVGEKQLAFINRCTGCKGPSYHSKHCALARAFKGPPAAGSGTFATLKGKRLASGGLVLGKPAAGKLNVKVSIDPGTSKRCGLKIGPLADGKSLEIVCAGNTISAAGVTTSVLRRPDQKTFDLHVYVEEGVAKIYANSRVQFDVPCKTKGPATVTAFAEKGNATLVTADMWAK